MHAAAADLYLQLAYGSGRFEGKLTFFSLIQLPET